ncbi:MAG: 2Fe-2S iron-sulfur cluster-binding protein [Acidimicrobiia bacterium]|nr:2Fe-2S iron-sulfur cluster-binding protein [Acidimicrobiia bacterium]
MEGLAHTDGALDPLQRAFIEDNAFQCGYCTGGMLLAAHAYLADEQDGDSGENVFEALAGKHLPMHRLRAHRCSGAARPRRLTCPATPIPSRSSASIGG